MLRVVFCVSFCDCCLLPVTLFWGAVLCLFHACCALGAVLLFYSFVSMRDWSLCVGCVAVCRQCVGASEPPFVLSSSASAVDLLSGACRSLVISLLHSDTPQSMLHAPCYIDTFTTGYRATQHTAYENTLLFILYVNKMSLHTDSPP